MPGVQCDELFGRWTGRLPGLLLKGPSSAPGMATVTLGQRPASILIVGGSASLEGAAMWLCGCIDDSIW